MKKEIYKGWRYPCSGTLFEWYKGELYFREFETIYKIKKAMSKYCPCGKNCKPIKVKITVEEE